MINYPKLLSKPKFSLVEKIKTIGSSYMVAAGLLPGVESRQEVILLRTPHQTKHFSFRYHKSSALLLFW